jgi:hypothetical protein
LAGRCALTSEGLDSARPITSSCYVQALTGKVCTLEEINAGGAAAADKTVDLLHVPVPGNG